MALDINQRISVDIPQFTNFSSALEGFAAQIQQLGEAFATANKPGTNKESPKDLLGRASGVPDGEASKSDNLATKIQQLISALEKNTERLNQNKDRDFKAEMQHQKDLNNLDDQQRQKRRQEAEQDRESNRQERRSNWAKSIAYGAGMLGIGYAGQFGKIAGSQAQAVNAGMMNYSDFMTNYYNRQADAKQSLTSGALMAGAGIAGTISKNPYVGLLAMGTAAVANYFTGQSTEQDKAGTQLGRNEELAAWRLQMSGMGGSSTSIGINTGFGKTGLGSGQAMSLSPRYGAYAATYNDVVLGGKRDVMSGMSDKDLNEYNRSLNLTAMAIGTSDIGGLNKSVSTLSGITGDTPSTTLNKILYSNEKYGGDTAANTAKLVQILESTPLGAGAANDLVNRYQFNEPMMNNQLALATASPLDAAKQHIMMQAGGASAEEMRAGELSAKHKQQIANNTKAVRAGGLGAFDPRMQILSQALVPGQTLYANDSANVNPANVPFKNVSENTTAQSFGKFIQDSLSNILVTNQTVKSSSVEVHADKVVFSNSSQNEGAPVRSSAPRHHYIDTGTGGGPNPTPESGLFVVKGRIHG